MTTLTARSRAATPALDNVVCHLRQGDSSMIAILNANPTGVAANLMAMEPETRAEFDGNAAALGAFLLSVRSGAVAAPATKSPSGARPPSSSNLDSVEAGLRRGLEPARALVDEHLQALTASLMRDPAIRAEFGGNSEVLGAHLVALRRATANVPPPALPPEPAVAQPLPRTHAATIASDAPAAPAAPPAAQPSPTAASPTFRPTAALPDGQPYAPEHGDRSTVAAILRHLGLPGVPLREALGRKAVGPALVDGVLTYAGALRAHVGDPARARRFEAALDEILFERPPVSV
jgi:hypothetical protein